MLFEAIKMKIIKEKILVEEIQSLLLGKTIDFFESEEHNLKLQISGAEVKDFQTMDVENLDTKYIQNHIKLLERELNQRESNNPDNKSYCVTYRDEWSAVISAKSKNEAIDRFLRGDCVVSCIGTLWEEFIKVEE